MKRSVPSIRAYPPQPAAVPEARQFVSAQLVERGLPTYPAELVVTELVSNAVSHACTPFTVRLTIDDLVRIEVADEDPRLPVAQPDEPMPLEKGRGLHIIAALATAWGVRKNGAGKTVWCTIDASPGRR